MSDPHYQIKKNHTEVAFEEIEDVICTEYNIPVLCDPSRSLIKSTLDKLAKNVEDDIFYAEQDYERQNTVVLNDSQKWLANNFEALGKKVAMSQNMPYANQAFTIVDQKIEELKEELRKDPSFDIHGVIKMLGEQIQQTHRDEIFSEKAERVNKQYSRYGNN